MSEILNFISSYAFLAAFFAPVLGGEIGLVVLGFLATQGEYSVFTVIAFGFLGMLCLDIGWYAVTHSKWGEKIKGKLKVSETYIKLEKKVEKVSHRKDILILLLCKILVGTRLLIFLIYLTFKKMTFFEFIKHNSVATFIWANFLVLFGWFAGKGYYSVFQTYSKIGHLVASIILTVAILYLIIYILKSWIIKE